MDFNSPVVLVLFVVALWFVVGIAVSFLSGWAELARIYRLAGEFSGNRWRLQSGQMRLLMGYNNCLTVGANRQGLHVATFFLFRAGHPPLFIPWSDISVRKGKSLWLKWSEFRFRQAPSVWVRLNERLSKRIEDSTGPAWPGDRGATGAAF